MTGAYGTLRPRAWVNSGLQPGDLVWRTWKVKCLYCRERLGDFLARSHALEAAQDHLERAHPPVPPVLNPVRGEPAQPEAA
jgi:hypothetical protein